MTLKLSCDSSKVYFCVLRFWFNLILESWSMTLWLHMTLNKHSKCQFTHYMSVLKLFIVLFFLLFSFFQIFYVLKKNATFPQLDWFHKHVTKLMCESTPWNFHLYHSKLLDLSIHFPATFNFLCNHFYLKRNSTKTVFVSHVKLFVDS